MRTLSFIALALSTAFAGPVSAQGGGASIQSASTADQLASVIRRLAVAPRDLDALVTAGELSVKLDDMSAAAAFFSRADKVNSRHGRVKAGMASILVRAERPGEALRFYQLAERYGYAPSHYAADRALAYDLLGEQERAQRDYRLALRTARDDETVRRYALSLGISGDQEAAAGELDPLLRRQDRAAWRARAFVHAMNGEVPAAARIANTMLPAGMASGFQPFLQRLAGLSPADRAFAVHFGDVRATPARLADARLKPALPPLGPDPTAPVQVAAAQPSVPAPVRQATQRGGRSAAGPRDERVQLASARKSARIAPPRTTASSTGARPAVQPPRTAASSAPASVDARPVAPAATRATNRPALVAEAPAARPAATEAARTATPAATVPGTGEPVQVASAAAVAPLPVAVQPGAGSINGSAAPSTSEAGTSGTTTVVAAAAPAPTVPPVPVVRSEDSILARIVASITVPGEELGVAAPPRPAAPPVRVADVASERTLATGTVKAAEETADRATAAKTIAAVAKRTRALAKVPPEKPDAKPGSAKAKPPAKETPEAGRYWVQVAGGADEAELPRAWAAAQKKAAALKGRDAYTTPLRLTNRVLTGPFKTEAEAQALVNQLARQGVSAFQFTSAAGQKITKLPAK